MRDDSADQIFEEFQDIVQQAILQGFPNPERRGCPGAESMREMANRPRPTRDAAWEHVTHCSPCYREFLDLRGQVKARREAERRQLMRRRILLGGAVIVVAGVIVGGYELIHHGSEPRQTTGPYQSASLDLKDRSVARSVDGPNTKSQTLVLPAQSLDLTIFLPIGSEPGNYEVQLLKKIDEPLLDVSGNATVERGTTILRTKLDLAGQPPGSFLLGLRQPPADWTYYPVTIH